MNLLFSERRSLSLLFEEWKTKTEFRLSDDPLNVITWLEIEGLLDSDKARDLVEKRTKK